MSVKEETVPVTNGALGMEKKMDNHNPGATAGGARRLQET